MNKLDYVYIIAGKYAPPDLYECDDEPGVFVGYYPYEVYRFIDMVLGKIENDFPCTYEKFCADRDIMDIVDAYNKRIGSEGISTSDGKKILQIDKETLYYGVMFVYYLTELKCTNAKISPDTVRQQLLNLRERLNGAGRFTLEAERMEFGEKDGKSTQEYVKKEPVRIYGRALIANLVHCIDELLQKDVLYYEFDSSGVGIGRNILLDGSEVDLYATDDRITYVTTRKAWIAMDMLKYMFGELNLPDMRARKHLDVSDFDGKDDRSYSINRMIAIFLNLMYYSNSRDENFIKSLKSKYRDFNPNTLLGF